MTAPARPPYATGWRLFWRAVRGRAFPRIIALRRQRDWLVLDIVLPLMSVAAYVFVYRALRAPEAYIGFVILGGAMTAFWLNVLWGMATQLFWEKQSGNLPLYIMSPAPLMALLLGMAVGGMANTTARATAILLLGGWLFGVDFQVTAWLPLLAVFVLTLSALYGLGMVSASLFLLSGRGALHISALAQEPVYLLSGFYFPVKALPFWAAAAGSLIPLTLGMDAMRQLSFPDGPTFGLWSVRVEVAALVVMTVVFLALARWTLAVMERRARRDARLTARMD